jgi:hypothetical protein
MLIALKTWAFSTRRQRSLSIRQCGKGAKIERQSQAVAATQHKFLREFPQFLALALIFISAK